MELSPAPTLRRKCGPGLWAWARSRARAGPMHFLLNIGPGGRTSGRLSSKTAKSQTLFISNMVYRLLTQCNFRNPGCGYNCVADATACLGKHHLITKLSLDVCSRIMKICDNSLSRIWELDINSPVPCFGTVRGLKKVRLGVRSPLVIPTSASHSLGECSIRNL